MAGPVVVMGIFVADLAFEARGLPVWGETMLSAGLQIGPGGKGANQAIAASLAGASVRMLTRIGDDDFGTMAQRTFEAAGVPTDTILIDPEHPTGAACVIVEAESGQNAIVVCPGASGALSTADVERARGLIEGAALFVTQLEIPVPVVAFALEMAHGAGVRTILNPAPAAPLPDEIYAHVDILTPNEQEAAALVGHPVQSQAQVEAAGEALLDRGVGAVILTLGERGAFLCTRDERVLVPAFEAGRVIDTTGAGDAFNGGLAAALSEGADLAAAVRFGCATAGIAVTRPGTAPSMPSRQDIEALLQRR